MEIIEIPKYRMDEIESLWRELNAHHYERSKKEKVKPNFLILILFFYLLTPPLLYAGKLDNFENEATKKEDTAKEDSEVSPSKRSQDNTMNRISSRMSECDSCIGCAFELIFQLAFEALYQGGQYSWDQRLYNGSIIGTPILPTISLDTDYQHVDSDLYSINNRVEIGFGPFGFQYKELRYFEKEPKDQLKIYQFNYLHRMSDGKFIRVDLGLGSLTLEGNEKNTGFSLLAPIYVFLPKRWSLFLRPNWGWIHTNTLQDYKLGFLFSQDYYSFQAGYRFVKSGEETLNGPFCGFNLHY